MTQAPHADRDGSEEPFWQEGDPGLAILPPYWLGTMKPIAPAIDWKARAEKAEAEVERVWRYFETDAASLRSRLEKAEHTLGILKRLADRFPHSFGSLINAVLAGGELAE